MNKKAYRGNVNQTRKNMEGGDIAYVYRLDPPFEYTDWYGSEKKKQAEYVFASGVNLPVHNILRDSLSGSETLVFPCDEDGEVLDWGEIEGGRGYIDPDAAIKEMGYEIVVEENITK